MSVVLHDITAAADPGTYRLDVSVDGTRSTFMATTFPDGCGGGCDLELFFLMSERSLAERGTSTQYHADLLLLLRDVQQGKAISLRLPSGSTADSRAGQTMHRARGCR